MNPTDIASAQQLEIFCDEAGNTGPALLDPDQRYFAFSSVSISDREALEIVQDARSQFPVQMPELKAAKLLRTERGRQLSLLILSKVHGRYAVVVHDKILALCAHFYEYVFEPVFRESPWFLYSKKLNLFVAMVLYAWFRTREADAERALTEFQSYLRTLDPDQAPLLFGSVDTSQKVDRDPLDYILRFVRACRHHIVSDNATIPQVLPAGGRWLGDLATTSLWCHLNHWGSKGVPIALTCDVSKPLQAVVNELSGDENDAGIIRAKNKAYSGPLGWRYARPVAFGDSREHSALQIADVIAGLAAYAIREDLPPSRDLDLLRESLHQHCLIQCVLPDFTTIDPTRKEAAVNGAMLYRLAQKAEAGLNLHAGLEADYAFAEAQWDAGGFRMG